MKVSRNKYLPFFKLLLVVAVGSINLSGCRRDVVDNVHPPSNAVWLQNMAFNPLSITVKVNSTVTWTNKDDMNHTVTSNSNIFNSGILGSGLSFSCTFTSPGTYSYQCLIHANMIGTVIVQ